MSTKRKTSTKLRAARRLMTRDEIKRGVSPFLCKEWVAQKKAIKKRVERKQGEAHKRAIIRRQKEKVVGLT